MINASWAFLTAKGRQVRRGVCLNWGDWERRTQREHGCLTRFSKTGWASPEQQWTGGLSPRASLIPGSGQLWDGLSRKSRNQKMKNWLTGARLAVSEKCGLSLRLWGHAHRFNHLESHSHSIPSNSIPSGDTWFGVLFLSKTKQKPAGLLKTAYLKIAIFHLLSVGGKGSLPIPHCTRQFADSVRGTQMNMLCSLKDSQRALRLHAP